MPDLKVSKVSSIPGTTEPNTLYLCRPPGNTGELVICCTDSNGIIVSGTLDRASVAAMVEASVQKADQTAKDDSMGMKVGIDEQGRLWGESPAVSTWIQTNYLPNVGDSVTIQLGPQISLRLFKTSNAGNEIYRSEVTATSEDRIICYRRDSNYDNAASEGSNENNFLLKAGVATTIDGTVYGSMRDFARVTFVDMVTLESWIVRKFFFGKGYFRAIVEHHRDPSVPSESVPLPVYP